LIELLDLVYLAASEDIAANRALQFSTYLPTLWTETVCDSALKRYIKKRQT